MASEESIDQFLEMFGIGKELRKNEFMALIVKIIEWNPDDFVKLSKELKDEKDREVTQRLYDLRIYLREITGK